MLEFFGDEDYSVAYRAALKTMCAIGGREVVIDYAPFADAAKLLYEGPWVAERVAAIQSFWTSRREALYPITRQILAGAERFDAVATFQAMYRLDVDLEAGRVLPSRLGASKQSTRRGGNCAASVIDGY